MAFSSSSSSPFFQWPQTCCLRIERMPRMPVILEFRETKRHSTKIVRLVLPRSKIGSSDNGGAETARILLERLFAQTQKLEEQMSKDPSLSNSTELGINLEVLESNLQDALLALRKKEDELQDAERLVSLDRAELNRSRYDLEVREKEIAAAYERQKKMEENLKKANEDLACQVQEIEKLRLTVQEQDKDIVSTRSALSLKEDELEKMRNELLKKNAEVASIRSDIKSRDRLLKDAKGVIRKQEATIQQLRDEVRMKEQELAESMKLRNNEEEKLKVAEANLEERTLEWLQVREELSKMAEAASKQIAENKKIFEDYTRVKALLSDVRSELISSQKSLTSSRQRIEDQEYQLEKQLEELNKNKLAIVSYSDKLKDAHLEVDIERSKLKAAESRNEELAQRLLVEQESVKQLEKKLCVERSSLEQATKEIATLQNELEQKVLEYSEAQNLLQVKESELVEARLQIQHLRSELASIQLILKEKDADLLNAQKKLEEVNNEVFELRNIVGIQEEQLIQVTARLQEKEDLAQGIQQELDNTKMKFSEATKVVERITALTKRLVISANNDGANPAGLVNDMQIQLATELEMTKESLKAKELEFLAAQRALAVKEEELQAGSRRWDEIEKELNKMKEEMPAWERSGEGAVGEEAIEKLQLEAARLEVEAATSALRKLAQMSEYLLEEPKNSFNMGENLLTSSTEKKKVGGETEREVARLLALTEQLVKEAGIVDATGPEA